jgi:hypothetical protein
MGRPSEDKNFQTSIAVVSTQSHMVRGALVGAIEIGREGIVVSKIPFISKNTF